MEPYASDFCIQLSRLPISARKRRIGPLYLLIAAAVTVCLAQPNRITSPIDNGRTVTLANRVHPLATPANDLGAVTGDFQLPFITMNFQPTAAQKANLEQLLIDEQNPSSPGYRQWLTPEQYADRFGLSQPDLTQITSWLQAQGFSVNPAPRSRTYVTFGGTAAQVEAAFGASIHQYNVAGKVHYANFNSPTVPEAMAPVVAGFRGLNDFKAKPNLKVVRPHWTNPPGGSLFGVAYALAPDDFATIYNVSPLYASGTNGSGQTIAIAGQTELYRSGSDVIAFWNQFGISATLKTTLVTGSPNPGISPGYIDEAALDTEWSGAVARGATINFVYSGDVWASLQFAIDQDLAQVASISYDLGCELADLIDLPSYRLLIQQANAEGITVLAAAGDDGATGCDDYTYITGAPETVAEGGLAVETPGSIPEVTSIGGTQLSANPAYWNTTNSSTFESAKPYVAGEESAWNDTAASIAAGGGFLAGGGGASSYFPQPAWQTPVAGTLAPGRRTVPDVSFNASVYNVPYYVYCSSNQCSSDQGIEYVGGTSCGAPAMAGVVALLNQYLKSNGAGNINPTIYSMGQNYPSAFHDTTAGNNDSPCAYGSPGCGGSGYEGYNATAGYDLATGWGSVNVANFVEQYSAAQPTGAVVTASVCSGGPCDSNGNAAGGGEVEQNYSNPIFETGTNRWTVKLLLTESAGISATLTSFSVNGASVSSEINSIFGTSSIGARQTISGTYTFTTTNTPSLQSLPANVTLTYSGTDAKGNAWSSSLTVPFEGQAPQLTCCSNGTGNGASFQATFAPGMIMSVFGTDFGVIAAGQAASVVPLPLYMAGFEAGICPVSCDSGAYYPVPLYYVGPSQVNLQVPFEIPAGTADLNLENAYQDIDYTFTVAKVAPGIFTVDPTTGFVSNGVSTSASPGQVFTLYFTGQGAISPTVPDGFSPAANGNTTIPTPLAAVTVSVAGIQASMTDGIWFVGVPGWSVGVTQVNFTIPAGVPSGKQPVVVTVGGTQSAPAYITIQ